MADSEGARWVSAADAADAAGVAPDEVRTWAEQGTIVSQLSKSFMGDQVLVRLDDVLELTKDRSEQSASSAEAIDNALAPILKTVPELIAQTTSAADRAARAETKVEFLSAHLAGLREKLKEAEDKLGDTLERNAEIGARAKEAEARVETLNREIESLRTRTVEDDATRQQRFADVDEWRTRARDAEDRAARAEAQARAERSALEANESKIEELTKARAELTVRLAEFETAGSELPALRKQLDDARERATGLERLRDERVAQLESERDERIAALRAELEQALAAAAKERDEQVAETEREWQKRLEDATKHHDHLKNRVAEAGEQVRKVRAESEEVAGRLRQMADDLATAQRRAELESERADKAVARAESLTEIEARVRSDLDVIRTGSEKERAALQNQVRKLEAELSDRFGRVDEVDQDASLLSGQLAEARRAEEEVRKELEALRAEVQSQRTPEPEATKPSEEAAEKAEEKAAAVAEASRADLAEETAAPVAPTRPGPPPAKPEPTPAPTEPAKTSGPIDWGTPEYSPPKPGSDNGDIAERIWGEGQTAPAAPSAPPQETSDDDPGTLEIEEPVEKPKRRRLFGRRR